VSNFIAVLQPEFRVGAKLSFMRTRVGHGYEDHERATIPLRSPRLIVFVERYRKRFYERRAEHDSATRAGDEPD
jgi:hypothetical protein